MIPPREEQSFSSQVDGSSVVCRDRDLSLKAKLSVKATQMFYICPLSFLSQYSIYKSQPAPEEMPQNGIHLALLLTATDNLLVGCGVLQHPWSLEPRITNRLPMKQLSKAFAMMLTSGTITSPKSCRRDLIMCYR